MKTKLASSTSLCRLLRRPALAAAAAGLLVGSSAAVNAATVFSASLDGPSEFPPVPSPGLGSVLVTHDAVAHTLWIEASFSGLLGLTTVAHIHAPTAEPLEGAIGVAVTPGTLPGFPVGVSSGDYSVLLDLTAAGTYTAAFLALGGGTPAGAEALLVEAMNTDRAYFNIHTNAYPAGEIRGFLAPVPTPEGGSLVPVFAAAMTLLAGVRISVRRHHLQLKDG